MSVTPTDVARASDRPYPQVDESPGHWPRDILAAYARYPGPYTVENAETILDEEPVELYNGWLVWQEMTDFAERRVVANIQDMLSISARKAGFGQALPDQLECLLSNGDVVKPDASLVSWERVRNDVKPIGSNERPLLIGGPELAVEVRSPSNWRAQERRKRELYFANNVLIVWDVDEPNRVIWVYRTEAPNEPARYGVEDEIDCEPLLPGWRRQVADIFAEQASAEAVLGEVADALREEGVAKGVEEGMAKTLRGVLPQLARAHFGAELPADAPARLAECDLTQLQALQAATETCASLEAWLALLPDVA